MKGIIVDIDGTLANNTHRQHFMEQKPKDWKSFYDAMELDTINEWCRKLVNSYPVETLVILVTGRPSDYMRQTMDWLNNQIVDFDLLYMRKAGDHRQDCIVKKEILEKIRMDEPGIEIEFVIDDRKQCVDMWRAEGLVCLQCAEGNF